MGEYTINQDGKHTFTGRLVRYEVGNFHTETIDTDPAGRPRSIISFDLTTEIRTDQFSVALEAAEVVLTETRAADYFEAIERNVGPPGRWNEIDSVVEWYSGSGEYTIGHMVKAPAMPPAGYDFVKVEENSRFIRCGASFDKV